MQKTTNILYLKAKLRLKLMRDLLGHLKSVNAKSKKESFT